MKGFHSPFFVLLAQSVGLLVLSCGSNTVKTNQGVDVDVVYGAQGQACGRGLTVVQTDYVSTNVALLEFDGSPLSPSLIHSGASDVQLNAPIGGDVVFPRAGVDNQVVLIDRYPASVLTFLDVPSGQVAGQINVRSGFDANPRDYLQLDEHRALVSRFETNSHPGKEPFDQGDDVLVIDVDELSIVGRIDLGGTPKERARPSTLLRYEDQILVALSHMDAAFQSAADAELVALDAKTLEEEYRIILPGMEVCEGLSLSPNKETVAVSCSGIVMNAEQAEPSGSGLVLLRENKENGELEEVYRQDAAAWGLGPLGFSSGFLSDDQLLVTSFGALDGSDAGRPDRLVMYEIKSSEHRVLLEGAAFSLGSVACTSECGRCYVTDAQEEQLHLLQLDDRGELRTDQVGVDTDVHLPPRHVGFF